MTALRVVSSEPDAPAAQATDEPGDRRHHWGTGLVIALALAVAMAASLWNARSERRAIERLPEPQRQALFSRTLQNLRSVCAEPADSLHDFCYQQAQLAIQFSECDAACERLAGRLLSRIELPR